MFAGNHEYYRYHEDGEFSCIESVNAFLKEIQIRNPTFKVLLNESIVLDNKTFYGGTGWFKESLDTSLLKARMKDFTHIPEVDPWLYIQNANFIRNFPTQETVVHCVVSHHLPIYDSVPIKYIGDRINCYFVSGFYDIIESRNIKHWVHGHTHTACRYKCNGTQITCNPLGNPNENKDYNYFCIIEF